MHFVDERGGVAVATQEQLRLLRTRSTGRGAEGELPPHGWLQTFPVLAQGEEIMGG